MKYIYQDRRSCPWLLVTKLDPFLPIFLQNMMFSFSFGVFFFQYADPVADLLDKWDVFHSGFRLFRESCVFHKGNYVKDLSKLGRDLPQVIIVDNSPASYIFHPENAVRHTPSHLGKFSTFWIGNIWNIEALTIQ